MFTTKCFIRKNTLELQQRLKELGYRICICAAFDDSVWLATSTETSAVHGKGFVDNSGWTNMDTQEKALASFLRDAEKEGYIDCGDDEEKFLTLAALRDDK